MADHAIQMHLLLEDAETPSLQQPACMTQARQKRAKRQGVQVEMEGAAAAEKAPVLSSLYKTPITTFPCELYLFPTDKPVTLPVDLLPLPGRKMHQGILKTTPVQTAPLPVRRMRKSLKARLTGYFTPQRILQDIGLGTLLLLPHLIS